MDLEEMGIMLERFIRDYVPQGWKESISSISFIPIFTKQEMVDLFEAFQMDDLRQKICNRPWYVQRAIEDFFKKEIK